MTDGRAARSTRELYLDLYRRMRLIRGFEDLIQSLFLRGEIYGTTHLYSGQEAVAVGFASVLEDRDRVAATYRGHGHALALGVDPQALLDEMLGRATGDQRRPRGLDERHLAEGPADRLASASSAARSPPRPAPRSRSGAPAASRSRTSATAR